jgi:acetoin utilization protein AcuB
MTEQRSFTVGDWMTPCPLTVDAKAPLSSARVLMRDADVRHLPVLAGGRLVGALSQRDLHLLETLGGVDRELVLSVEDAMTPHPFVVGRHTTLEEVAKVMVEKGYGSAIVVDDGKVAGVFTTTDALRALTHGTTLPGRWRTALHAPFIEGAPKKRKKKIRIRVGDAFISSDPTHRVADDLAETLAEQYLSSVTSGEEAGEEAHESQVSEEEGGPFIITRGKDEFAKGVDPSNPPGSLREPLPSPMRGSKT